MLENWGQKRIRVEVVIIVLVAVLALVWAVFRGGHTPLDKVNLVAMAGEENLCVLTEQDNTYVFYRLDREGRILDRSSLPKYGKGVIYRYVALRTVGEKAYLQQVKLQSSGKIVLEEIILQIAPGGKVEQLYARAPDTTFGAVVTLQIMGLTPGSEGIHFFVTKLENQTLDLVFLPLPEGGNKAQAQTEPLLIANFSPQSDYGLEEICYFPAAQSGRSGQIVYVDGKSRVYRAEMGVPEEQEVLAEASRQNVVPLSLRAEPSGEITYTDGATGDIRRYSLLTGSDEIIWTHKQAVLAARTIDATSAAASTEPWKLSGAQSRGDRLMGFDPGSARPAILDIDLLTDKMISLEKLTPKTGSQAAGVFLTLLAALALYLALRVYILLLTEIQITIVLKQALIFIPVILGTMYILYNLVAVKIIDVVEQEVNLQLCLIAETKGKSFPPEQLAQLRSADDFGGELYRSLQENLEVKFGVLGEGEQEFQFEERDYYCELYLLRPAGNTAQVGNTAQNDLYIGVSQGTQRMFALLSNYSTAATQAQYWKAVWEKRPVYGSEPDLLGNWKYIIWPILSADQSEVIALLEMGTDLDYYQYQIDRSAWQIALGNAAIALGMIVIFLVTLLYALRSLRSLRAGVQAVSEGQWGIQVKIRSNDEVTMIGRVFNRMSKFVERHVLELTTLNEAYYRFVPRKMFDLLGKDKIQDIDLGAQMQGKMTVMFSNTKDFFELSASMRNEEIFAFINSNFNRFAKMITDNSGLIIRYDTAGIVSLFPNKPEQAVQAALAMRAMLYAYNSERLDKGRVPIDIGVALSCGPIMVGVVGQGKSMSVAAISEHMNLILILETLNKTFACPVLATQWLVDELGDTTYNFRYLGRIISKDNGTVVSLYELVDAEKPVLRRLKIDTRADFDAGVALFYTGDFYEARKKFIEVLRICHADAVAKIYLQYCDEYEEIAKAARDHSEDSLRGRRAPSPTELSLLYY